MNTLIVKTDWEHVYGVDDVRPGNTLWGEELFEELKTGVKFYSTEIDPRRGIAGYFVKTSDNEKDAWCCGVYRVRRALYQMWKWELLTGKTLEYDAKEKQCRLVEEIDIKSTREIIDNHSLWGNTIEIVKALRDGLDPSVNASYKDLCLGIILDHVKELDKYLGLLPQDSCPRYKEVLHSLGTEEESEEESEEEDTDSEHELELQEAYREGKKDGYEEAYSEIHECEECHKPTKEVLQKCDGTERQDVLFVCKACEQK